MIEGRCSLQDGQAGLDSTKDMPVAKLVLGGWEHGLTGIDLGPVLVRESKCGVNVPLITDGAEELSEVMLLATLLTIRGSYQQVGQWQTRAVCFSKEGE